jgi:predicted SnoaL-like aldol condensation-catalyzing enzyme
MVKMCDLSESARKEMVSKISWVMSLYRIDKESINEFWDTVQIGIEARRKT